MWLERGWLVALGVDEPWLQRRLGRSVDERARGQTPDGQHLDVCVHSFCCVFQHFVLLLSSPCSAHHGPLTSPPLSVCTMLPKKSR